MKQWAYYTKIKNKKDLVKKVNHLYSKGYKFFRGEKEVILETENIRELCITSDNDFIGRISYDGSSYKDLKCGFSGVVATLNDEVFLPPRNKKPYIIGGLLFLGSLLYWKFK